MGILPSNTPQNKPHYVYTFAYPESMGGSVFYVGKGYKDRINEHEQRLRAGIKRKGDNPYKENVIKKIWNAGEEVVKEKLASFATHKEALELEVALIFLMRPYGHLTNLTDGGDGYWGYVPTEEMRRYMGEVRRGRKASEATLQRMSEAQKGKTPWNKGVAMTEEHRLKDSEAQKVSSDARANVAKMNAAKKDVPLSEEHRRKVSEAGKDRVFSEEHRRNLSLAGQGRKRAPFSEEWKRNMAQAHRGKKYNKK